MLDFVDELIEVDLKIDPEKPVKQTMPQDELKGIVDIRQQVQKMRIATTLRIQAVERGADTSMSIEGLGTLRKWHETLEGIEESANSDIAATLKRLKLPIFSPLVGLKGIGPILAGKIISPIDIHRAETCSALWRYAGYGTVDGKRERPIKGEKLHYNRDLKIAVRLAVESFLKSRSPYAAIYGAEKERWMLRPDMTKMHAHNAAIGKTAKVFLSHLWETWRKLEGLPVRALYVHEKLGHTTYIKPEEFGWPVI